jgi:ferredoxin
LTALAYGARQIRVLCGPDVRDSLDALVDHIGIVETVLAGLGYDGTRIHLDSEPDPDALETSLYAEPPAVLGTAARHRVLGEKRTTLFQALDHLFAHAPSKTETIALPAGSPFGDVILDQAKCTLCLACVGACPTAALGDNPETPKLSFTEVNCVQCGLCRATCPEGAIQLAPRLALAPWAKQRRVLKEDDPFDCIRCGKPFAARASIERVVEKLTGHSMFASADRLELIKMCDDCRVMEQFEDKSAPFAAGPRPPTRTTEDDLLERARKDLGMPPKNEE